jgi:uncharacterized membrane protein
MNSALDARYAGDDQVQGKTAAAVVYILYFAGVLSAHLLSPLGVIVAYVTRGGASPLMRTHLDSQIGMFWKVVWWMVGLALLGLVLIPFLGVGLLVWLAILPVFVVLTIWFAVKSVLGLVRLASDRPA